MRGPIRALVAVALAGIAGAGLVLEKRRSRRVPPAPSTAISDDIRFRLVTTVTHVAEPGSSGRTWSALCALSSMIRIRRSRNIC